MRIAFIGTRGVPARYGGFETAVEEVGRRLAERGHEIVVYCRGSARSDPPSYLGMDLVQLPTVKTKVTDTLVHTGLSVSHACVKRSDVALVFNAANAAFLPLLRARKIPVALHVDGLEWKRAKWGPIGQRFYLVSERLGVRWADQLIADARGIQDHYRDSYGAPSTFIPYGAPILEDTDDTELLNGAGVLSRKYHLVVARFEPENHVDLIVEGYLQSTASLPLVVVGSAPYSGAYTQKIRELADRDDRVKLAGAVWDQDLLNALYANAATYIHGHSVGGTNPSLLRAMGAGASVLAFDVVFSREVLGDTGRFFDSPAALAELVEKAETVPDEERLRGVRARARATDLYDWDNVATDYENLCLSLLGSRETVRAGRR